LARVLTQAVEKRVQPPVALKEFETFPERAQSTCLAALTIAAEGGKANIHQRDQALGGDPGLQRARDEAGVAGAQLCCVHGGSPRGSIRWRR